MKNMQKISVTVYFPAWNAFYSAYHLIHIFIKYDVLYGNRALFSARFFMPYGGERLIYRIEIYCIRFRIVNYPIGTGNCAHKVGCAGALEEIIRRTFCTHFSKS